MNFVIVIIGLQKLTDPNVIGDIVKLIKTNKGQCMIHYQYWS